MLEIREFPTVRNEFSAEISELLKVLFHHARDTITNETEFHPHGYNSIQTSSEQTNNSF